MQVAQGYYALHIRTYVPTFWRNLHHPYTNYKGVKIIIFFLASWYLNMERASSYKNSASIVKENTVLLGIEAASKLFQNGVIIRHLLTYSMEQSPS